MKALALTLVLVGTAVSARAAEFFAYPHLRGVSITKFCDLRNGYFQTKNPVKVCDLKQVEFAGSNGEDTRVNEFKNVNCRMEIVTVSKTYSAKEIVSWPMGEGSSEPVLKDVKKTYPNTWNVEVQSDLGEGQIIRTIQYTIPNC